MENPAPESGDLHAQSGLDIALDNRAAVLRFGPEMLAPEPVRRRAAELNPVLMRPAPDGDDVLYTLYRGVAPADMAEQIARRGLLYVALVLRAGAVGEEWVRTRGHTNSPAPGTRIPFPEIHEVWQGRALAYLQSDAAPDVAEVATLEMGPGDKVVIPPGWAGLLANIGDAPLAVGSWRTADCVPQYEALEALGGMAHFVLAGGSPGACGFEPNTNYRSVPVPRKLAPREFPDWGLRQNEPMLTTFRRNPEFFRFLTRPQDYDSVWASLYRE
jgi:glucose-6-phosphate isomerase